MPRPPEHSDDYFEAVSDDLDPSLQRRMGILLERKKALHGLTREELLKDWNCPTLLNDDETEYNTYKSLYWLASIFRGAGKYQLAQLLFAKAYEIVIYIKSLNIDSPATFIRETSCHDCKVRCNVALQSDHLKSVNEMHQLSCAIFEELKAYIELTKNISKFNTQDVDEKVRFIEEYTVVEHMIDTLDIMFGQKNAIDVSKLIKVIEYIHKHHKKNGVVPEQARHLWRVTFYLTRLALLGNTFYEDCTDHYEKVDEMRKLTTKSADISVWYRQKVPEPMIQNDELAILPTLSEQTKWFPMYRHILKASSEQTKQTGEHEIPRNTDITITEILNNYKTIEDLEGAVAVEAKTLFHSIVSDEKYYPMKKIQFKNLYSKLPRDPQLNKARMEIKLYEARAALRYISPLIIQSEEEIGLVAKYLSDAEEAYQVAASMGSQIEGGRNNFLNKWLFVVKAQLDLVNYRINRIRSNIHMEVINYLTEEESNEDGDDENGFPIEILRSLENLFPDYKTKSEDIIIDRQKIAYSPQEAEINYILGLVEFEKARLFADELKKLKTSEFPIADPDMLEKIHCFDRARARLCTAYTILNDIGSKDKRLFSEIERCYRELLAFNYRISGVPEDKIPGMLDFNMETVAEDYQLETWTNVYYNLVRGQKFADDELFRARLSESLEKASKQFAPMARNLVIVTDGQVSDERYQKALRNHQVSNRKSVDIKKNENYPIDLFEMCNPDFDYFDEDGYITVLTVSANPTYKIIIESELPLKKTIRSKFEEDIGDGVSLLLKLNQLQRTDTSEMTEEELHEHNLKCLEGAWEEHIYLMRKHPETLEHEIRVSDMLMKLVEVWNRKNPNMQINNPYLKYIGLFHDTGKANPAIDPHLILNKRWSLLPFERKKVEWHGIAGPDYLRGRLGLENFRDLIAVIAGHHVKYFGKSYPVSLNGNDILDINDHLKFLYTNITEHERRYLDDAKLSLQDGITSRLTVILDVFEALTSDSRAYRKPMILDRLFGIFNSDKGEHFDPYLVDFFIEAFNEGEFDEFLQHEPYKTKIQTGEFKAISENCYSLDLLLTFVKEHEKELSYNFGLDFNKYIEYLKKGQGKNIHLSNRGISANIFDGYKVTFDYAEANKRKPMCDHFVDFFIQWLNEQGYGPSELTPLSISNDEWEELSGEEAVA